MNDQDFQHLAAIVRDSQDAIIGKTLDGIITSWNAGAERIYGYAAHEAVGRPIAMLVPSDRADEVPAILRRLTEGTGIHSYETVRVTKDGRLVNISLTVSPIRDANGVLIGASSIARDVTRQKAAEAALRASARAYQLLMEQASDAILVSFSDQRLLDVNQRACEMLGYSREELLQLTENDIILPELAATLPPRLDEVLTGKIITMDRAVRRKDGTVLIAELSIRRLDDGRIVTIARDITTRKRAEQLLQASEARYRAIVEDQSALVVRFLHDGTLTFVNTAACRTWDLPRDALLGSTVFQYLPGSVDLPLEQYLDTFDHDHTVATIEQRSLATDGTERWVQWTLRAFFDEQGICVEFQAVGMDLTPYKLALAALQTRELQLEEAQAMAHVGSWELDLVTGVVSWSDELYRIFGLEPQSEPASVELYQRHVHLEDRALVNAEVTRAISERSWFDFEHRVLHPDGSIRVICSRARVIVEQGGRPVLLRGASIDITERKTFEAELQRQAFHDPLTGLANRALFSDRLEHALAGAVRSAVPVAVLYLDLDRFKVVNDSLSHAVGDRLLVELGRRVQTCLRPEDTVARLGGDEFAVLLVNVATTADACSAAERILDVLRAPFTVGEHTIMITISIGIAVSATGQRDAGELLRAADLALYRAKQTGKAHYEVFEAGMASRAQALLELEVDLRGALERGELRIHYQPNVELDTGRVVGVEALLRWEHPHRGLVSPDMFIPIAEETGLILPIERWVLMEACRQTRTWQTMSPVSAALELSVNLSPSHFQHPELIAEVRAALDATGLHPGSLVLEITERAVMTNATANVATLHALKQLGVQLAIDDFGTGYSSLSYLHHFPVDILKIDRSFIDGLGQMAADTVIVRTVIALAQSLGLVVVAEGVETAEQVTQLRGLGCRLCQGFYFFRPLPSGEVDTLLVRDG